jgi:hypothetical protein
MDHVAQQLSFANRTQICPICRKPDAFKARRQWNDGSGLRAHWAPACGHDECFLRWLPGTHQVAQDNKGDAAADQ